MHPEIAVSLSLRSMLHRPISSYCTEQIVDKAEFSRCMRLSVLEEMCIGGMLSGV